MVKPQDETVHAGKVTPYLIGKTIKRVDERACNVLNLEFTDGTELMLEAESGFVPLIVGYVKH